MAIHSLELPATLSSLTTLENFVRQAMEPAVPSPDVFRDIRLVLEELLVNIVFYAYPGEGGKVRVECSLDPGGKLCIRLRDWGIPFNPLEYPPPRLEGDMAEREIGGLGIHLVKQLAHEIRYFRQEDSNVLTVYFQL